MAKMEIKLGNYIYDNGVVITISHRIKQRHQYHFKWYGGEKIEMLNELGSVENEITMGQWKEASECKTPLAYVKLMCMSTCLEYQMDEVMESNDADEPYTEKQQKTLAFLEAQIAVVNKELDIMLGAIERNEVRQ